MNKIESNDDALINWIKHVILKCFPIEEDRMFIIEQGSQAPQLDITIDFYQERTIILFLIGTRLMKASINDKALLEKNLEVSEIYKIIDFILNDHRTMVEYNFTNDYRFDMNYVINWCDEATTGIGCSNIKLEINFKNNPTICSKYLYDIFNKYKKNFINSMNDKQLLSLLKKIDKNDLKEILLKNNIKKIDDLDSYQLRSLLSIIAGDSFYKYFSSNWQNQKENMKKIKQK